MALGEEGGNNEWRRKEGMESSLMRGLDNVTFKEGLGRATIPSQNNFQYQ